MDGLWGGLGPSAGLAAGVGAKSPPTEFCRRLCDLVTLPLANEYIYMEKRILRLEDEFWRIRTDTGELTDAERDALRTYLDEKGFKTAMIDDNLAIAGELTWQEVIVPIEGFYEGKADVYPF